MRIKRNFQTSDALYTNKSFLDVVISYMFDIALYHDMFTGISKAANS